MRKLINGAPGTSPPTWESRGVMAQRNTVGGGTLTPRKRIEFSKIVVIVTILLVYPSVFVLSWKVVGLAEYAIASTFTGALPYLTAIITPAWASFATVLGFYFSKSKAENREKIRVNMKRDY